MCDVDEKESEQLRFSSLLRDMDSARTLLPWAWARRKRDREKRSQDNEHTDG